MITLERKEGLVAGIAGRRSIAFGCARGFRELGMAYLNEEAEGLVRLFAEEPDPPLVLPLHVRAPGQLEAVYERVASEWGKPDFVLLSIGYSPRDDLDGFATAMDV